VLSSDFFQSMCLRKIICLFSNFSALFIPDTIDCVNRCLKICTNGTNKCFYFEFLIVFSFQLFIGTMLAMAVFSFPCRNSGEEEVQMISWLV